MTDVPKLPRPRSAPSPGFVVELDAFSGPLDLLLHLLREEQLEIADIPIARIADQFLQAVHELGPQSGRRLPRHGEPAGAAQGADAACRARRRTTAGRIPAPSWSAGCWSTSRSARSRSGWDAPPSAGRSSSLAATCRRRRSSRRRRSRSTCSSCSQAVERVIAGIPIPVLHRVVARPLDVEGGHPAHRGPARTSGSEFGWLDALGPRPTIVDVLSTLLALLELAKRGSLRLAQPAPFSPMVIARDPARPAA